MNPTYTYLGHPRKLIDGKAKVLGHTRYTGDVRLPGMLYARPLLSPYAHARIVAIDRAAALAVPGVVAVLLAADLPTRDRVASSRQSTVLAHDEVLFRGHPVALVVAESEAAARDGVDLVEVEYAPLPVIATPAEALATDAFVIWPNGAPRAEADLTAAHAAVERGADKDQQHHSNLHEQNYFRRGNVEQALAEADVVIERTYRTAIVHQGYLEPHAAVADPDPVHGGITLYTSTQDQFGVRNEVARMLGLPRSKVILVPMAVGGGFGAKYGIIDPLVGAAALALKRPVALTLTRSEDFLTTTPAPATEITLTLGATHAGRITGLRAKVTLDNGVFPFTLGGIVSVLLGGYYKCDHIKIVCNEVLTHKPQAGAYRAPGAPQATFALEAAVDELAQKLGIDPLEFRLQNAVGEGDLMGNGDPWPAIGMRQCLAVARDHPLWKNRAPIPNEGVGLAVGGWPCGMTTAGAVCRADSDGKIQLHVGSVDISGVNSTFVLIAAEILTVAPEEVEIVPADTRNSPYAGASGGSQITYSVSGAVAQAAQAVRRQLLEFAAELFEARYEDMELRTGRAYVRGVPDRSFSIAELAEKAQNKAGGPGPIVGEGRSAVSENAPGFVVHLAHVRVDPETGHVTPLRYVAIQDVGFALNPLLVEGQIHGGSVQGLGWALHEAMRYDEHGELLTASFMDYDLPHSSDVPPIETVLVENPAPHGPFGARGIGEPPITAGAAAIANAIRAAVGVHMTELPMRDEVVWRGLVNTQRE